MERDSTYDKSQFKPKARLLWGMMGLLLFLVAWMVPSGKSIGNSAPVLRSRDAAFDIGTGADAIIFNVSNKAMNLPRVFVLPMNDLPCPVPNEQNFRTETDEDGTVHSIYEDKTIKVDCYTFWYSNPDTEGVMHDSLIYAAKVKIAHPTQLRTAFAGGEFGTERRMPSEIARSVNAVVSINGDFYNYGQRSGMCIRQGTVYREGPDGKEVLFIDSNGDFSFAGSQQAYDMRFYALDSPDYSGKKYYQCLNFGPTLVRDGEILHPNSVPEMCKLRGPRSAIGQTGPLEYVLVAVAGRRIDGVFYYGMNTYTLAEMMHNVLGCTQAYNLDGGQSSVLTFHNKPYSLLSNGDERPFGDIIFFATADPEN